MNINAQIQDYRLKQQSNFKCRKNNKQKETRNHPNAGHANNTPARKQTTDVKKVLVIGDSMVKHIDRQKIERAAGCQSVVHSYSGAKVEQINAKIKEYWSENDKYDAVILHVGTNNLVSEEPEEVVAEMDGLIKNLKGNARKIAVSSVVKRYDNRVSASKITRFNDLANNLCTKHNTTFLNNDHINKSLLNRSNLHLNREGDRVLDSVFCSYLKSSVRVRTAGNVLIPAGNHSKQFFHQVRGRQNIEWKMYLQYVNQLMKN